MSLTEQQALEKISQYAGMRFDLIQAGGGNTSAKNVKSMLVKSSGIILSEVTSESGYVEVDFAAIRDWFKTQSVAGLDRKQREQQGNDLTAKTVMSSHGKPSIETFLHALLNTYTLHSHPLTINAIACRQDWQKIFLHLFPEAICVAYATPGIDLALELVKAMQQKTALPKIVFLQNHGLIVSSDDVDEVISLTETINNKAAEYLGFDISKYTAVTALAELISGYWQDSMVVYCSDDREVANLLSTESKDLEQWPFCPDTLVYCGLAPAYLESVNDTAGLADYVEKYQQPAKVIVVNNQVYFVANNLKKAREAEELLKFHLLVVSNNDGDVNRLSTDEAAYLTNWDAEKYRQGV